VILIGVLSLTGVGSALAITFNTPSGSKDTAGDPVSATAVFTFSDNTVTITLTNNQVGEKNIGQNISDLEFSLSSLTTGTLISSSGLERTVNSNKTFTDGSVIATGWVLTPGATFLLDVLSGTGHVGPAHTLIGPVSADGKYDNALGSIAGSSAHNPFLAETATFTLNVPGVTAATTVNNVVFSFGATDGADLIPGVPLPPSALLLGSGLLGMGLMGFRRKLKV
jgi:hypothetical protein